MARRPTKAQAEQRNARIREQIYGDQKHPHLLMDVPVQPDAWLAFADAEGRPVRLLLVPTNDVPAGEAARRLRERLDGVCLVVPLQGVIAICLHFRDFVRAVLPALGHWHAGPGESRRWLDTLVDLIEPGLVVPAPIQPPFLRRVSADRETQPADVRGAIRSCRTVKADAARVLFGVSCEAIVWAVLDTGIDSSHPCFRDHRNGGSRIIRTYDFRKLFERLETLIVRGEDDPERTKLMAAAAAAQRLIREDGNDADALADVRTRLSRAVTRLQEGRDLEWALLEPFVLVADPSASGEDEEALDHGTAVASIIAADWRASVDDGAGEPPDGASVTGMCPDIRLMDIRVLGENGGACNEFDIIAALQFLRHRNDQAGSGRFEVHGANLSLSTFHNVREYGCGATLVCQECDSVSASGVLVVVAAGNNGHALNSDAADAPAIGRYATVSITDPGNAASVITVGSTHAEQPHRYGVSWFSSRGPTGDGRMKPDIVAPGEKIGALGWDRGSVRDRNGTSFAAPHVSGAAALLMARHPELAGRPERVKAILCETATDLGRDRSFQGAGLLDTLRALQRPREEKTMPTDGDSLNALVRAAPPTVAPPAGRLLDLLTRGDRPNREPHPQANAPLEPIGEDERQRRTDTNQPPLNLICSIEVDFGDGRLVPSGTGWLAGPRTVVTAAHVLHWQRPVATRVRVIPGRDVDREPFGSQISNHFHIPDHWNGQQTDPPELDIAAIRLPAPFPGLAWLGVAALADAALSNRFVSVTGYPAVVNKKEIGAKQLWWHAQIIGHLTDGRIFYTTDTSGGQSGAPVILMPSKDSDLPKAPLVVGVHSRGTFTQNSGTRINAEKFGLLGAWIDGDTNA
jgi:V8-like Glu-specific endopeptidase